MDLPDCKETQFQIQLSTSGSMASIPTMTLSCHSELKSTQYHFNIERISCFLVCKYRCLLFKCRCEHQLPWQWYERLGNRLIRTTVKLILIDSYMCLTCSLLGFWISRHLGESEHHDCAFIITSPGLLTGSAIVQCVLGVFRSLTASGTSLIAHL